jgi:hypothetical protein
MSKTLETASQPGGLRPHRHAHRLAILAATWLAGGVALTWFWSTVAVEGFAAPELRFVDALSAVLVLLILAYGTGAAMGIGLDRPSKS